MRATPGDACDVQDRFRVAIHDAHLEFLIDGDGDYFATLVGRVVETFVKDVPAGLPFEILLGPTEPALLGVTIAPGTGSLTHEMAADQIEPLKAQLHLARGRPGALQAAIRIKGRPEIVGNGHGRHWHAADLRVGIETTATGMDVPGPEDRALDADIRLIIDRVKDTNPRFEMTGRVGMAKRPELTGDRPVDICLDPALERGDFRLGANTSAATLSWPLRDGDASHITEMIARAKNTGSALLLEIDLGAAPWPDEPDRWPVTDVAIVATGLLR